MVFVQTTSPKERSTLLGDVYHTRQQNQDRIFAVHSTSFDVTPQVRLKNPTYERSVHFQLLFCPFFVPKHQHLVVKSKFFVSEPHLVIRTMHSTCLEETKMMPLEPAWWHCIFLKSHLFRLLFSNPTYTFCLQLNLNSTNRGYPRAVAKNIEISMLSVFSLQPEDTSINP